MALNQTMEVLAPRDEDIPVSEPSAGLINTDFDQLYTLLANRVSALEVAIDKLQRPEPSPTNPDPEPEQEDSAPVEEVKEEITSTKEETEKETD